MTYITLLTIIELILPLMTLIAVLTGEVVHSCCAISNILLLTNGVLFMIEVNGLTAEQVVWAQEHDWYLNSYLLCNGNYAVRTVNDMNVSGSQTHFEYADLREWAGY